MQNQIRSKLKNSFEQHVLTLKTKGEMLGFKKFLKDILKQSYSNSQMYFALAILDLVFGKRNPSLTLKLPQYFDTVYGEIKEMFLSGNEKEYDNHLCVSGYNDPEDVSRVSRKRRSTWNERITVEEVTESDHITAQSHAEHQDVETQDAETQDIETQSQDVETQDAESQRSTPVLPTSRFRQPYLSKRRRTFK